MYDLIIKLNETIPDDLGGFQFPSGDSHVVGWGCPINTFLRAINLNGVNSEIMGTVNYFIPVQEFATFVSLWTVFIGLYYGTTVFLRWMKAIS